MSLVLPQTLRQNAGRIVESAMRWLVQLETGFERPASNHGKHAYSLVRRLPEFISDSRRQGCPRI
jgi:hypothetical protein